MLELRYLHPDDVEGTDRMFLPNAEPKRNPLIGVIVGSFWIAVAAIVTVAAFVLLSPIIDSLEGTVRSFFR